MSNPGNDSMAGSLDQEIASLGRDVVLGNLRMESKKAAAAASWALKTGTPPPMPLVERSARARAMIRHMEGKPDALSDAAVQSHAAAVLADALADQDDPAAARRRALADAGFVGRQAQALIGRLNDERAKLSAIPSQVERLAALGSIRAREEALLAQLERAEGAEDRHDEAYRAGVSSAIQAAGGVDAVVSGLEALAESREPIAQDPRVSALAGRLTTAQLVAEAPAEGPEGDAPSGWSEPARVGAPAEDPDSLRAELDRARGEIRDRRRAEARRIVEDAAQGDIPAAEKLCTTLAGSKAPKAVALRAALLAAARAALKELAPAMHASHVVNQIHASQAGAGAGLFLATMTSATAPRAASSTGGGDVDAKVIRALDADHERRQAAAKPPATPPASVTSAGSASLAGLASQPARSPLAVPSDLRIAAPAPLAEARPKGPRWDDPLIGQYEGSDDGEKAAHNNRRGSQRFAKALADGVYKIAVKNGRTGAEADRLAQAKFDETFAGAMASK